LRVRSAIAVLFRASLFLSSRNLLDLRIKGQEPKKLTVTIERKEKKKREKKNRKKVKEKEKNSNH